MAQLFSGKYRNLTAYGLLILCSILSGCNYRTKKADYANQQCNKLTSLPELDILFDGYTSNELDTILVKEISSGVISDTVIRKTTAEPYDERASSYFHASLKGANISHKYLIIIPGQPIHTLNDLKIGARALSNMTGVDFECGLEKFELDGVKYDQWTKIIIHKI